MCKQHAHGGLTRHTHTKAQFLALQASALYTQTYTLTWPCEPTGDQRDIDMTQIIGPKSCLHNLINLQFPHNRRHRAVPRSYCVAPPPPDTHTHSAMQTHHCSPQQDALLFSPFPPKSPLSLPDACCSDTNVLLLLSSLSKHRQEGKSLTVCLVPYATWQQSPTDMVRVWATAKGSLKKKSILFCSFLHVLESWAKM